MVKKVCSRLFAPHMIPLWIIWVGGASIQAILNMMGINSIYYLWFLLLCFALICLKGASDSYRKKQKYSKYIAALWFVPSIWLFFVLTQDRYTVYALIPFVFFFYLSIELCIKEWKAKEFGIARLMCIPAVFIFYQMYQIAAPLFIK